VRQKIIKDMLLIKHLSGESLLYRDLGRQRTETTH